jgi:hypothetical protein
MKKIAFDGKAFNEKNYWLPFSQSEIQAFNNVLIQNIGY